MKHIRVKLKHVTKYALVDDEDYHRIKKHSWYLHITVSGFYAFRCTRLKGKSRTYGMHREVLNIHESHYGIKDIQVDHRNKNPLDNRKENLRLCTRSENMWNKRKSNMSKSSKFKGVSYSKQHKHWTSIITFNKKVIFIGGFKTEKEAAQAYNNAAMKYHGQFASVNKEIERIGK